MNDGYDYEFIKATVRHLPELMSSILSPGRWDCDERFRLREDKSGRKVRRTKPVRKYYHASEVPEIIGDIFRAWKVLKPRQKRVLELWALDGMKEEEVGGEMGVSQPMVHYMIRSSIKRIHRFLEPDDISRGREAGLTGAAR